MKKSKFLSLLAVIWITALFILACSEPDDGGKNNGAKDTVFKVVCG